MKTKIYKITVLGVACALALSACKKQDEAQVSAEPVVATAVAEVEHTAGYNVDRNPYFGQTHQHTGWSFDEAIYNVRLGPENSYRHARGEKVKHPSGYDVQLKTPLDFLAVSDHAEYLGVLIRMYDPNDPLSQNPLAKALNDSGDDVAKSTKVFYGLVAKTIQPDGSTKPDPELDSLELKSTIWDQYVKIADSFNEPGKFTALVGYEWSSQPNMSNLHRNVIFRSSKNLPVPFSYFDSQKPEDLWKWMDAHRANGTALLAIPHNGNLSNGLMYALTDSDGNPLSKEYVEARARNEKLTEIIQTKGQSETHPLMAPNDEFAFNFELWTKPVAGPGTVKVVDSNYVRNAFGNGMVIQQKLGTNPFKYGVVGGGDIHTSIVSHEEYAHTGEHNLKSGTPHQRLLENLPNEPSKIEQGTAGLSCVWAEENTREAIWDAMERKETWATSGTRITLRVFAGKDFGNTKPGDTNWAKVGYAKGVPMGGDLKTDAAPSLMIAALKDPNSGNLDRIQVVKGWVDASGKVHNKIYNVAWSEPSNRKLDSKGLLPSVGNSVDIKNASYTNDIGASELNTVWKDPEFDPTLSAFYYVRVLEIPTPRWSTYDAKALGIAPPKDFPATIQERAWSSPIWYTPNKM